MGLNRLVKIRVRQTIGVTPVLVTLVFSTIQVNAQEYFEKIYEEFTTTTGRSIRQTTDGGFISCGATRDGSGGVDTDFLIKKFDSSGNETWTKSYGNFDDDKAYNIRQTPDGGYIFCGEIILDSTYKDLYIGKLDATGEIEWEKNTGGSLEEYGLNIAVVDDGYAVIGVTKSYGSGGSDIFLVKFDLLGNIVWQKTYGGSQGENGRGIAKTNDGGFVLAGNSEEIDDEGEGNKQLYLIKIDHDGNVIWDRYFGATGTDKAYSVTVGADGNYVASGYSLKSGKKEGYVVKVDTNGNLVWQKNYEHVDYYDNFRSIDHLDDGSFIVVGNSQSTIDGIYDVIVLHIDSNGNELWRKIFGGSDEERGYNITVCADDNFIFIGSSASLGTDEFGDFWVVKTLNCDNLELDPLNIISNFGTQACDSLLIDATPGFANYLWNNGIQTQQNYIKNSGWYQVSTQVDQCKVFSDSIYISIIKPIDSLISSKILTSCSGNYYELSLNRNPLDFDNVTWSTGQNDQTIKVYNSGNYILTISSDLCGSFSESINIPAIDQSKPSNFNLSIEDPYTIILNWDSVEGVENYQVLYGLENDSLQKLTASNTTKRISNLRCCSNYNFYVKSFCQDASGQTIGPLKYSTPKCAGYDCNYNTNYLFNIIYDFENELLNIFFIYPRLSLVNIRICDAQGRILDELSRKSYNNVQLDVSKYSSGMYIIYTETDQIKQSAKFLVK